MCGCGWRTAFDQARCRRSPCADRPCRFVAKCDQHQGSYLLGDPLGAVGDIVAGQSVRIVEGQLPYDPVVFVEFACNVGRILVPIGAARSVRPASSIAAADLDGARWVLDPALAMMASLLRARLSSGLQASSAVPRSHGRLGSARASRLVR